MAKIIKFIIFLIFVLVLIALANYYGAIDAPAQTGGKDQLFVVESGASVKKIAANLKEEGLISSVFYFETYVWRQGVESKFQAGEYMLNPMLSIKEVVDILTTGRVHRKEMEIKITEGWNLKDIDNYFHKQNLFNDYNFAQMTKREIVSLEPVFSAYDFMKSLNDNDTLEGFFFPDTYRIYENSAPKDLLVRILGNFNNKLTQEMKDEIRKQGRNIKQVITMASLIEKEVRSEKDMKIVSGLFWQRIKNGQPLQSCATLAYILGENKKQYTIADTKIISPYNTYQNKGLPPGPIGNPGLKAIMAAVYPDATEYNYFLSRPDTGETVFSGTYAEHLRSKAKYLD